jgi:hypothetical protein
VTANVRSGLVTGASSSSVGSFTPIVTSIADGDCPYGKRTAALAPVRQSV